MIKIKEAKRIMAQLGLKTVVIFGVDSEGFQHIATSGKTERDANQAASFGDGIKKTLKWPDEMCNSTPLKRICGNCSYWQKNYHRPGSRIPEEFHGKCMIDSKPQSRYEKDIACAGLEPNC